MRKERTMKVTVIGGTGLIGSKVVAALTEHGHEAVAAAPETGVDILTGQGVADAVGGADAVVDVSNSPSFEGAAAMDFFTTSSRHLLAAELAADVRHHVALSVVGTNWLTASGYFRAKSAQEASIAASGIPYTIVRATQFFEFVERIAAAATEGDLIRVAPALVQPMAADDVARAVGRIAVGEPAEGIVEIAGPEEFRLDVFIDRWLQTRDDPRRIEADQTVPYFGAVIDERDLLPQFNATLGSIRYADWLRRSTPAVTAPV
jgi:uncharacterized protein YbjT (DUF2867 family)